MMDMVFSCPSCRKPLVVEEAVAGTRIQCPLCDTNIRVPALKTAWLTTETLGEKSFEPARQNTVAETVNRLKSIEEIADSLLRNSEGHKRDLERISQSFKISRQRITAFARHTEPLRFKHHPSESVQIPPEWSPLSKEGPWKAFTLIFGLISILLALGMLMMIR